MKVEQSKLNEYLKKIHGSVCPLCGNNHWNISDQVFQAVEFDYKGILIGGTSFPMVPLTCDNCGNTYFINALKSGLIDPPDPENPSVTKSENEK
ncbi:hypothetical protein DXC04_08415 [Dorea sp. OM07-5]|uniref:hypothetical protein n=1 Tax=Dorea sp. OM07-5 TaxID=2293100 RepID=UPI000E4BA99E|nr:hypothetical protein [Dorea sp. OM07-5]RHU95684.1 hypothetical protein DXC04_08415 [Dorea sp. OM07-5]